MWQQCMYLEDTGWQGWQWRQWRQRDAGDAMRWWRMQIQRDLRDVEPKAISRDTPQSSDHDMSEQEGQVHFGESAWTFPFVIGPCRSVGRDLWVCKQHSQSSFRRMISRASHFGVKSTMRSDGASVWPTTINIWTCLGGAWCRAFALWMGH